MGRGRPPKIPYPFLYLEQYGLRKQHFQPLLVTGLPQLALWKESDGVCIGLVVDLMQLVGPGELFSIAVRIGLVDTENVQQHILWNAAKRVAGIAGSKRPSAAG